MDSVLDVVRKEAEGTDCLQGASKPIASLPWRDGHGVTPCSDASVFVVRSDIAHASP